MSVAPARTAELFGDKYHDRYQRTRYQDDTQEPCAHCAKPVNINRSHWRVEFDQQGSFAIGPECRRLFPDAERCEL